MPIDPGGPDIPLLAKSLSECEAACEADSRGCSAVVREKGQDVGDCWLRSAVNLNFCDRGTNYNVYVRVALSPPVPPEPTTLRRAHKVSARSTRPASRAL